MREIEKAFKSGQWAIYIANLIKEKNQTTIYYQIVDYLKAKNPPSASYTELNTKLKIPQSTLNEVLKNTIEVGWLTKYINDETKQFEYYATLDTGTTISSELTFVHQARDAIWLYVYDNPKLSPSEKVEISSDYIIYLLDKLGRMLQLKQINKLLKDDVTKTNFELQDIETTLKINFALAKKFGFATELHRHLNALILPYDAKKASKVLTNTETKLRKYYLPTTAYRPL